MTGTQTDHQQLITWLAEHDEDCLACRYPLRGVPDARCPECGTELRMGVRAVNLRLGAWGFAVVSCALGLGFDGVVTTMLSIAFIASIGQGPIPPQPVILGMTLGFLGLLSFLGIVFLHKRRARWIAMAWPTQVRAAGAVFVFVGAVHAIAGVGLFFVLNWV